MVADQLYISTMFNFVLFNELSRLFKNSTKPAQLSDLVVICWKLIARRRS